MPEALQYRFFTEVELPETCFLQELLLWAAAQYLPVAFYTQKGTECRQAFEFLYEENGASGEPAGGHWLEPAQTDRLGIERHPRYVEYHDYPEYETGISSVSYLRTMIEYAKSQNSPFANPEKSLKELEAELPLTMRHEAYSNKWKKDFEDAIDFYRALVLVKLRSGELVGRGVPLSNVDGDNDQSAWDDLAEKERSVRDDNYREFLSPIPTDGWISCRIEWTESRFEASTGAKSCKLFHTEQAVAFKVRLQNEKNPRTKEPFSLATINGILGDVKAFFKWLAWQPGYKSRISPTDADYFSLPLKTLQRPAPIQSVRTHPWRPSTLFARCPPRP